MTVYFGFVGVVAGGWENLSGPRQQTAKKGGTVWRTSMRMRGACPLVMTTAGGLRKATHSLWRDPARINIMSETPIKI
jgi:hypothetical protein